MDEGNKRRLPLWMLGVSAAAAATADQASKPDEENRYVNNNEEEGISFQSLRPKSKPKVGTKRIKKDIPLPEQEYSEVNPSSCVLAKCETKTRRRKLNRKVDDGRGSEACETVVEKKRCSRSRGNSRGCAPKKQKKPESLRSESSDDIENPSEDDEELTMEDLISIAHEYVKTDDNMEKQSSSHRENEVERRFPAIALSGKESGGLPNAPQSNRRSPVHKEIVPVHNSTETSAGEGPVANTSRTGDPAQDMLDLFLGPLLKKPPVKENKMKLIKMDMEFACEVNKQRKNDITTEELVPLTKKKSSLKDQVAMFLD